MMAMVPVAFPTHVPEVRVGLLEDATSEVVTCDELQWWFVVPRPGETSAAGWYDRDTSELTAVRRTRRPVSLLGPSSEDVLIEIEEATFDPEDFRGAGRRDIVFTARPSSIWSPAATRTSSAR